jgi:hypothetical protein
VKTASQLAVLLDKAQHLAAIHTVSQDIWPLLVEHLLSEQWRVDDTEKAGDRVKEGCLRDGE